MLALGVQLGQSKTKGKVRFDERLCRLASTHGASMSVGGPYPCHTLTGSSQGMLALGLTWGATILAKKS